MAVLRQANNIHCQHWGWPGEPVARHPIPVSPTAADHREICMHLDYLHFVFDSGSIFRANPRRATTGELLPAPLQLVKGCCSCSFLHIVPIFCTQMDQISRLLAGRGGLLRARGGANGLGVLGGGVRAAAASLQHRRNLNLHEYQSMHLLKEFNIKTPMFSAAYSPEEAFAATTQLQRQHPGHVIVKAQVLAGGRGLGHFKENGFQGGVHSCKTPEEAADVARKMLGHTLVTKQTGAEGKPCNVVLVCEQFPVKKEMYLAMLLDRGSGGPMLIGR